MACLDSVAAQVVVEPFWLPQTPKLPLVARFDPAEGEVTMTMQGKDLVAEVQFVS